MFNLDVDEVIFPTEDEECEMLQEVLVNVENRREGNSN